ncbi:MAG TPA: fibronectin type III domain-containing protein [Spirochaetota bacterium]|nr:fibronectin type III domain-containing protein [Spirochaetota bacterium]
MTACVKRLLLLLILFPFFSYSEPAGKLTWQSVEGAAGYYIEIKDTGDNIVAAETVTGNSYDIIKLQPGEYKFRIATVNILGQRGQSTEWIEFKVEKLFVPELKSVSRKQIIASHSNRNIVIRGRNFKVTSRFILRGEGREIELADVDVRSENEAVISFKPEKKEAGRYDLVVINRGGVESVLKDAVVIVKPEEAETLYYLGAFYSVNMPAGDFPQYFGTSFTGGGIFFQIPAMVSGYDNFMFEAEIDAVRFYNTADTKPCSLTYVTFGIGIDYLYHAGFTPVEFIFKIITGPSYTILKLDESSTGKENSSIDWFLMLGAGARYYPGADYFIEPSFSFKAVLYSGTYLYDSRVSFACGTRF